MYILFVVSVIEQLWLGVNFSTLPNYNHKTIKEVKKHIFDAKSRNMTCYFLNEYLSKLSDLYILKSV